MICLSALKYNLTSCLPLSFVQKSYSYIFLPLLVVTIITCYCAWSVTFGWSSTSNISGQLQRYKILPGKLKVQWNHWNGSVGPSWHNLFYKTVRAEAQEPGSEISSTGNSSLSSESAFCFSKTRSVILKILKWLMSDLNQVILSLSLDLLGGEHFRPLENGRYPSLSCFIFQLSTCI